MKNVRRILGGLTALALAIVFTTGMAAAAAKPAPTGKVNINTASAEQLTALPGIGAKLALRIVEHRQKAGGFKTPQELMNVRGIGEKNFQKIQQYLVAGEAGTRSSSNR